MEEEAAIVVDTPPPHEHQVSPYINASQFSRITWSWLNSLLALGARKTLDENDKHQLMTPEQAKLRTDGIQEACPQAEKKHLQQEQALSLTPILRL
jgi:hypothetical protein